MRYKAGDKVRIKSIDWYNRYTNGTEVDCKHYPFSCHMKKYCGQIMTISIVGGHSYSMIEDDGAYSWTDEMIEGLVEEEDLIPKFGEYSDNEPLDVPTMTTDFVKEHGLPCPEGYIFKDENGNVINATKIVLEKKKKSYPKTYEECCKVMNYCCNPVAVKTTHKEELIRKFQFLLLYRDAYWKIAGDEMGLGKPWEPDWEYDDTKYVLFFNKNEICHEMMKLQATSLLSQPKK